MDNKILIAYASKYGSTEDAAAVIGEVLSNAGAEVELIAMRKMKNFLRYNLVVLGTSIRMGKPLKEAITFVNRYRDELKKTPAALFSVGLQMKEDTEENREKAREFLIPLLDVIGEPVSIELFGGSIDHKKFGLALILFTLRENSVILHS